MKLKGLRPWRTDEPTTTAERIGVVVTEVAFGIVILGFLLQMAGVDLQPRGDTARVDSGGIAIESGYVPGSGSDALRDSGSGPRGQ